MFKFKYISTITCQTAEDPTVEASLKNMTAARDKVVHYPVDQNIPLVTSESQDLEEGIEAQAPNLIVARVEKRVSS